MNERARDLVVLLRGYFGMLPGATSISLNTSMQWAFVLIRVASDEAVGALGEALGLTCGVGSDEQKWWWRATGKDEQGLLHMVIAGPPHKGVPPRGDVG